MPQPKHSTVLSPLTLPMLTELNLPAAGLLTPVIKAEVELEDTDEDPCITHEESQVCSDEE